MRGVWELRRFRIGLLAVHDGATYDVIWRNTGVGRCGVELRAGP